MNFHSSFSFLDETCENSRLFLNYAKLQPLRAPFNSCVLISNFCQLLLDLWLFLFSTDEMESTNNSIIMEELKSPGHSDKQKHLGFFNIYLLGKIDFISFFSTLSLCLFVGVVMKFGGSCVRWNYGLSIGFEDFILAIGVFGIGYLMLGLCVAEMVSVMAFDGGYYGYARILMGPLGGYLVGCSGLIESFFYFAMFPIKVGQFFQLLLHMTSTDPYIPLLRFIVYLCLFLSFLIIQFRFWEYITISGFVVIVLFLIYLLGSIPSLDYREYALIHTHTSGTGGAQEDVESTPLSVMFFMGFDLISLTSAQVKDVSYFFLLVVCFFSYVFPFHFSFPTVVDYCLRSFCFFVYYF
jgi:amino acid transporter